MIELEGVVKRFAGSRERVVLNGAELHVPEGAVALVSGASGAGKTTLLRLLHAAEVADEGIVRILGRDVCKLRRSSISMLRRRVGYVPQEITLFDERSALDNVAIALEVLAAPKRVIRSRAADALASVGLALDVDRPVGTLSTGERRRVVIARALVIEPIVLLADEPTAGLDPLLRGEFCGLLAELQLRDVTILVTTNDDQLLDAAEPCGWSHYELRDGVLEAIRPASRAITGEDLEAGEEAAPDNPAVDDEHSDAIPNVVLFPIAAHAGRRNE